MPCAGAVLGEAGFKRGGLGAQDVPAGVQHALERGFQFGGLREVDGFQVEEGDTHDLSNLV
jgi:hypothetical protein